MENTEAAVTKPVSPKFPHAHKGLFKVFVAAVISVFCAVLDIVILVMMDMDPLTTPQDPTIDVLTKILSVVCLTGTIIAFIIDYIGLHEAKEDNHLFHIAHNVVMVGLGLMLVEMVFLFIPTEWTVKVAESLDIVRNLIEIVVFSIILTGIAVLAKALPATRFAKGAIILRGVLIFAGILSAAGEVVELTLHSLLAGNKAFEIVVLAIAILEVVAHISYVVFLGLSVRKFRK